MPLIPPASPPPIAPNVTTEILLSPGVFSISSNTTYYATMLTVLVTPLLNVGSEALINSGTLWNDSNSESYVLSANNFLSINNSGIAVAHSTTLIAETFFVGSVFSGGITNSGSIYALADLQNATAIEHWQTGLPIINSGIIAAQAGNFARAIYAFNGSLISNSATGSILAEGDNAVAIYPGRGTLPAYGQTTYAPSVVNYGLIEARSTNEAHASVAIFANNSTYERMIIENYGIIRADVAIASNSYAFSPQQLSSQDVNNHQGGTIEGDIYLDLGDDHIVNQGTINGTVDLGEGDDVFDSAAGVFTGVAQMGWGNDRFHGGTGVDVAIGDRGDDYLTGGSGNDLLLGGWGNDTLQGDAGNDALYGEGGNDRIIASEGDYVDAGTGNDRVELGDFKFAKVIGGSGYDVLVLPSDTRILDLAQVVASGRVAGFEELRLADNSRVVIHSADVAGISGGSSLVIGSAGAGIVDLAGVWTGGATQLISGVSYRVYTLGGAQVLVAPGVTINLNSEPAGAIGLDAISGGASAPSPGVLPGADLTPVVTVSNLTELSTPFVIAADETWMSTNGTTVLTSNVSDARLTNYGAIVSEGGADGARGLTASYVGLIANYGTITVNATGIAGPENFGAAGIIIGSLGQFLNVGTMTVGADQGFVAGVETWGGAGNNQGTISVSSANHSTGIVTHNGGIWTNSGLIEAVGVQGVYGLRSQTHALSLVNTGTIRAHATGSGQSGVAIDLYYALDTQRITNSGVITGEVAIRTSVLVNGNMLRLENSGQINGRIELGVPYQDQISPDRTDVILNVGTINGTVALGAGRDVYIGIGGTQNGAVYGEGGADLLIDTQGRDTLDGGAGNDVLLARGGDTLTGGSGRDTFVFTNFVAGQQPDVITDFVSGTDRIDLSALAPSAVTITASTINVVTASGTMSIQVAGSVALGDIILGGVNIVTGTSGDDTLVADSDGSILIGGDGFDLLVGGAGNDRLDGGPGGTLGTGETGDIMWGGAGNDTYVVDSRDDLVFEAANGGYDTVELLPGYYFFTYQMADTIEAVIGGNANGNAIDNVMTGDDLANIYYGGAGADVISGGLGNDRLGGGIGADRLTGGLGADIFSDTAAGLNGDTIVDFSATDSIVITDLSYDGFTYLLVGNVLTFSGGSVTLSTIPARGLIVAPISGDHMGVELRIQTSVPANDFNGDGRSDILWRNDGGTISNWLGQLSGGFANNDVFGLYSQPTNQIIAATGDYNGDGHADILWRGTDGSLSIWNSAYNGQFPTFIDPYSGASITNGGPARFAVAQVSNNWHVVGSGDFNGDHVDDILWRNDAGVLSDWLGNRNDTFNVNDANALTAVATNWHVAGVGDFNGDGRDDILWRSDAGQLSDWLGQANGGFVGNDANAFTSVPTSWHIVGTGDFNGDGRDDILWRSDAGQLSDWLGQANGGFVGNDANAFTTVPTSWTVVAVGDYNGDGRDDILWRNANGQLSDWLGQANGGFTPNDANAFTNVPTNWHVQAEHPVI